MLVQIAPALGPLNQVLDVLTTRIEPLEQFNNRKTLFGADGNGRVALPDMLQLAGAGLALDQDAVAFS